MYTVLSALVKILGALPVKLRSRLGKWGGRLFSLLPTRERRVAAVQLDYVFGPKERRRILPKVYESLGQTLCESFNLHPLMADWRAHIEVENEELLDRIASGKKGAVMLTAHTGNWELLAALCIRKGIRLSTVAREARNPYFHRLLTDIRNAYGLQTHWRSEKGSTIAIIRNLRRGQGVGALIDQDTEVLSEFIPFFGIPCKVPSVFVELGQKCEADIVATFIFRTGHNRYRASFTDLGPGTVAEILLRYNTLLEKKLRQFPEQWVWFHKRWRSLPDGKTMRTSEYLRYMTDKISRCAVLLSSLFLSGCMFASSPLTHLERAEEFSREGKFDRAISEYEKHIEYRLAIPDRPEWENPYFYYLIIGDLYLRQEDVERSLAAYELAETHGVDIPLVSDRFRMVAHWYEKHDQLEKAIEVLTEYRDRDPLVFDDVLDRISKELVRRQDTKLATPVP